MDNADCEAMKKTALKRRTLLRKQSPKRKKDWPKYLKWRKEFLSGVRYCELDICLSRPVDVHHMRGRTGSLLLDKRYWMAVCRKCHDWIHSHPNEARIKGVLQ